MAPKEVHGKVSYQPLLHIQGANLCRDNYNHFTGKTMRSPVLDQDVKA